MDCKQCLEQLDEYVFVEERHADAAAIGAHLASCDECQAELDTLREAIALIPIGDEAAPESIGRLAELEQRVMREIQNPVTVVGGPPTTWMKSRSLRLGFAASLVACVATAYTVIRHVDPPSDVTLSPQEQAEVDSYAKAMRELRELESVFAAKKLHYVSLYDTDGRSRVAGYLVYDLVGGQVHFFCVAAEKPADSETYVLWLIDSNGSPMAQCRVSLDANNHDGTAILSLPADRARMRQAIVTREKTNDPLVRPTGAIEMQAKIDLE